MAKVATAAFLVVLALAALPALRFLDTPREVVTSTPSAFTGIEVPITLPEGADACADEILYDERSRVARFTATAAAPAPALIVTARGYEEGEYRSDYVAQVDVAGDWTGTRRLDVPLEPPPEAVFGTFCIHNSGPGSIDLAGNVNGRAYSRPTLRINGEPAADDLNLRFLDGTSRSYASRADEVMEHASTLRPFGAWWWWVLAVGLIAGAPAGVALAMRSALVADEAEQRAPLPAWPGERARRRFLRLPGWALVALGCALAVVWFTYWGVNTNVFQLDEDQYVYLSRWLQTDFPATLWNWDVYGRGLQRLEVWLLAIPSALFDAPWSLVGGRLLNTIAFVSTAIPVYLMARGLGLRSRWAALPAVVSVMVPWAVVTTSFLTENVAYPACLWAVWAIWRATASPSAWNDLLALILIVVAGAARTALLVLAPVLPAVVLATALRFRRLRPVLREHLLLWLAVAAAALPLVLGSLGIEAFQGISQRLAGGYSTEVQTPFGALLEKFGSYFSRSVVGTGFFTAVVALPWLALQLARPRDRRSFALAAAVVLTAGALLYSLHPAGPDERYIVYFAPLLLLPAAVAIARRELSPLGMGIAAVLLAALLARVAWTADNGDWAYFIWPAEAFYTRPVGLRLDRYLPGDLTAALTVVAIALGLAGVALAVALSRAKVAGRTGAVLIGIVVAGILVQTQFAFTKHVNGPGSKSAPGLKARAFVDRTVPEGASVGQFAEGRGELPEFHALWREVQFYNERIDLVYTFGPDMIPSVAGDYQVAGLTADERTGRIDTPLALPDYAVVPSQFGEVGLAGQPLQAAPTVPILLMRVAEPATLAWQSRNFEAPGVVPADGEGEVRLFGAGVPDEADCARFNLTAPPDAPATYRFRLDSRVLSEGALEPGEIREVPVPIPRLTGDGFIDLFVSGQSLQVLNLGLGEGC